MTELQMTVIEASKKLSVLTGAECATLVRERFPTESPMEIAHAVGLKVVTERWFPVTSGEFELKARTIRMNAAANIEPEIIIAHELGHYFLHEVGCDQDERFCEEFAGTLVNLGQK